MALDFIEPLIAQHGYLAVFLIVALESAGIPLPGETALVLAAVYAGASGRLEIHWVVGVAVAGAIIGDNIGFWAGRRFGLPLLLNHGHRVGLHDDRIRLGQYLFERHGGKIVFFGRFVAFLRIFAAFLAGANRYGWPQFLCFNAAGASVWAAVFGYGGYAFGDAFENIAGPAGRIALGLIVLFLAIGGWLLHAQEKKWTARAAEACPGPLRASMAKPDVGERDFV